MADEQYLSGEEYHRMHSASSSSPAPKGRKKAVPASSIIAVVAVIVLCGLSFAGGVAYQKHGTKSPAKTTAGAGFGGRAGGARRDGGLGQVTAVSSTSITIINQRTNASKTYAINSSTAITDNGQTVDTTDIKTGDTVLITASTSGGSTASRILVNPSFGGGFGGQSQGQGASGTDDMQTN